MIRGFSPKERISISSAWKNSFENQDPATPARYFVLLNPEEQAQAFRRKVIEISEFLKNFLEKYCSNRNRNLDFDNLRDGFLEEVDLRETAFSFVHDLFKLEYTLERTEGIKMDHAFGSIYQANLLFSLCRDIENVLSYKYQRGADNPTFYNYVGEELLPQSSLNMDQNKLGEINGARKNDFEDTVRKLLEETYQSSCRRPRTCF
ncbi:hypothetical protein AKJ65_07570 [candidate division MSBL1 archaeon SCGC-AAA259E19]|uniref:Uncharacterized protein n=1 Tax=candidate division MSBL1 archaeon SCGC-AAA259E19 TaxID=1698264 RepID=A0A133UE10_9EURY|nr:hypothetical protein AKJ65_07570 [candidate division MSBL1 archaeon SCGC-AAA259E19]